MARFTAEAGVPIGARLSFLYRLAERLRPGICRQVVQCQPQFDHRRLEALAPGALRLDQRGL